MGQAEVNSASRASPPGPASQNGLDGRAEFEALRSALARARAEAPDAVVERAYRFAPGVALVRSVGRRLAEAIDRSLAHLRPVPAGEPPALIVEIWDGGEISERAKGRGGEEERRGEGAKGRGGERATRRVAPSPPRPVAPAPPRPGAPAVIRAPPPTHGPGGVNGFARAFDGDRLIAHQSPHILSWSDRPAGHVVAWASDARRFWVAEQSRPLYFPMLLWHHDRGAPVVHAGLVGQDGDGVLLVGLGGSGKSTAALSCLLAGMQFVSDDYVALTTTSRRDRFTGHGLYSSCHLAPDHLARFPALAPHARHCPDGQIGKSLVHLADLYPDRLARSLAIRAVALPAVSDGERTQVCPAGRGQALRALAPSSMVMLPVSSRRRLDRMAELISSVPCYRLSMGRDLADVARGVRRILSEASGP